jgi:hypothetical protein
MKASRSVLITAACVVHIPWNNFSHTLRVAFFRNFAERTAESAMGTADGPGDPKRFTFTVISLLSKIAADLFVQQTGNDQSHYLTFTRRE